MTTVAPPDQTVWWDAAATTAAALDVLRLQVGDVDADRVAELVPVAGAAINNLLDAAAAVWPVGSAPAPLTQAIINATVRAYRNKDAPTATPEGMMLTAWRPGSFDIIAEDRALLLPYKCRFGVG